MLLAQQETETGNPTFEAVDPSFLCLAFPSVKLDDNACGKFTFNVLKFFEENGECYHVTNIFLIFTNRK